MRGRHPPRPTHPPYYPMRPVLKQAVRSLQYGVWCTDTGAYGLHAPTVYGGTGGESFSVRVCDRANVHSHVHTSND
eukprot:scaffold7335_cov89-Isochrysis_galbana.AAC.2